ncbi:MAG TPA: hypothetical protein VKN99_20150 [Polyangia bacterium]|nr:hypothetical protein [Polyangia bacterium]
MNKKNKQARLVSIEASVLGSVVGGKGLDVWNYWAFDNLATYSCTESVWRAAANAGEDFAPGVNVSDWNDATWSVANDAANAAWNGPACAYYGLW